MSPKQTTVVKMTHKSQLAPTENSWMEEANADADTTLIQEDAQRVGLI